MNLSCSYYGNPLDAEISWTKNGRNINNCHSIVTKKVAKSERNLTGLDLITEDVHGITAIMLTNVTKSDEGEYTCNATNTEGSACETMYLVVKGNRYYILRLITAYQFFLNNFFYKSCTHLL